MKIVKPIGPAQIEQSTDIDHKANIHDLTHQSDAFRLENNDDEQSANNLDALLRRVSEASTREIDNLMAELRGLRNKLHSDRNRIQGDIVKHTELSQGILQLATIVSDSVKKLPGASDIAQRKINARSVRQSGKASEYKSMTGTQLTAGYRLNAANCF